MDALDDVFGRRSLADDDVEVGFDFVAQHADGVGGQLAIDVSVLTNDVDDFFARGHVDFKGVVAQTFKLCLRNLRVVAVTHEYAPVLQALDVLPSDSHADSIDFNPRLVGGLLDGSLDGFDSVEDIGHDASFHTCGYGFAVSQDFDFSVLGFAAHDAGHFGCADV